MNCRDQGKEPILSRLEAGKSGKQMYCRFLSPPEMQSDSTNAQLDNES